MSDSPGDVNSPTQSPSINVNVGFPPSNNRTYSGSDVSLAKDFEGSGAGTVPKSLSKVFWIVAGGVAIAIVIGFLVSLIITQTNIGNNIKNVETEVINSRSVIENKIKSFEDNFNYFRESTHDKFSDIGDSIDSIKDDINDLKTK